MRIILSLAILLIGGLATATCAVDERAVAIRRLLGEGRCDEAFLTTRRIIDSVPDRASFYALLAEAGQYAGREHEADSILGACVRKGWNVGDAVSAMAWLDVHGARWMEAYAHFQTALEYGGNRYLAYAGIQEMHEKLHGRDAAISHLLALTHDHDRAGPVWYAIALAYWSQWDLTKARNAIEQARRSGPPDPRVESLHLAIRCAAGPDMDGLRLVDRATRDARARGDWEGMAFLQWVRMSALAVSAMPDSAAVQCHEALRMVEDLGMLEWRGQFLLQSGRDAAGQGDIRRALAATDSAAEHFRRAGAYDGILAAYALRLDLLLESFRYAEALDYCSRMLLQLDGRADPRLHAGAAIDAAWILSRIGGQRIAIVLGIQAESTLENMLFASHDRCRLNTTLASIHSSMGDSALAMRYGRTALRFAGSMGSDRDLTGNCEGVLGEIQLQCGNARAARMHFQRQWALGRDCQDTGELRSAALAMAHTYDVRTGTRSAAAWASIALEHATQTGDRFSEKRSRILLGRIAAIRRDTVRARAEFERAFACLEDVRRLRYLCSLTHEMRSWYIAQHADLADAFLAVGAVRLASAIMSRAREDVLTPVVPSRPDLAGIAPDDLRSLDRARRSTSALVHRTMLRGSLDDVAFSDSAFRALCTFFTDALPRFLRWDDVVRQGYQEHVPGGDDRADPCVRVGADEVAIDFVYGSDETTVMGMTRDTVTFCRIPVGRSGFAALARRITGGEDAHAGDADPTSPAGKLTHTLEPVLLMVDRIAGSRDQLVVIGDGPHTLIPFESLMDLRAAAPRRRLIDRFAVVYRPALTSARSGGALPRANNGRVLVVGDVDLPLMEPRLPGIPGVSTGEEQHASGLMQPLPGTVREMSLVEDHFGSRVDILWGADATDVRFCASAPGYWIIHLATHGAARSPGRKEHALYLSPSTGSDGDLGPEDILPLELQGSLVVLPVCYAGQMSLTEDVESIAHAFLEAGAGTVLAARWSVDDDLAVEFLAAFYGALAKGETKGDAVRSAMQTMIARGHHSYRVWAGFQLYGDGGALVVPAVAGSTGGWDRWLILLGCATVISVVGGYIWRRWRLSRVTSRS